MAKKAQKSSKQILISYPTSYNRTYVYAVIPEYQLAQFATSRKKLFNHGSVPKGKLVKVKVTLS